MPITNFGIEQFYKDSMFREHLIRYASAEQARSGVKDLEFLRDFDALIKLDEKNRLASYTAIYNKYFKEGADKALERDEEVRDGR